MTGQRNDLARSNLHRGYAGIALAAASWGTWAVFMRQARQAGPIAPELCTFVVFSVIGVVLAPLALRATRRRAEKRGGREWTLLGAFGVSDALNCALYFAALQTTTVAVAVLTHYLAPLLVAVGAPLVLGERRRRGTLAAVGIGLFGLALLLAPWNTAAADRGTLVAGACFGLGSAVFYAANVLMNKRLARCFDATEIFVYHTPSALLVLALLVPHGAWSISWHGLSWLVLGALGPGALAGVVFVRSLRVVPAAHASVLTLVEPFAAIGIASLAYAEALAPSALLGGAAILLAAYLVVRTARGTGSGSPASPASGPAASPLDAVTPAAAQSRQ